MPRPPLHKTLTDCPHCGGSGKRKGGTTIKNFPKIFQDVYQMLPATSREVSNKLGVSLSLAEYRLGRLLEFKMVERTPSAKGHGYLYKRSKG